MKRFSASVERSLLFVLLSCASVHAESRSSTAAPAETEEPIKIITFRVAFETSDTLVLDVDYKYDGSSGSMVYVSAYFALDGNRFNSYAVTPGTIKVGSGTTRIILRCIRLAAALKTNELIFYIYKGGNKDFYTKTFPHEKTWSWPDSQTRASATSATASWPTTTGRSTKAPATQQENKRR